MRTLLLTLTTCLLVLPAQAKYSGGSGTAQDPYQIATAADLIALGETPGDYDKHFLLTADLDLDPNLPGRKVFDEAVIAPDIGLAKYDFQGTAFTGVFDGDGHTISHLTIQGGDYLGLFGYLETGAEVRNLGTVDVNVAGSGDYVASLGGRNWWGTVIACYSTGTVSGKSYVGGLVGENDNRVICCYSTAAVTGSSSVGGLVGCNGEAWLNPDCFTQGCVIECYSTGKVRGDKVVGGLVGGGYTGNVVASLWDIQTSGQAASAGGTGKTMAEMHDPNTFRPVGWDFVGQPDGPHDIWAEPTGGGYPILYWQLPNKSGLPRFSGGTGEPNDPYAISTAKELSSIGHNPRLMKRHFKLVADLDLTGFHFYPIGGRDYPYGGVFDGNGHAVLHLTIKGENSLGLFGWLGSGAEVRDLGVVEVSVAGSAWGIGGLVGYNAGCLTHCYSTGTVSGGFYVGGLVGENLGVVTLCYSTGSVSGTGHAVGGLVGGHWGTLIQCHSTGAVSGKSWVGGLVGLLVGLNPGTLTHCYSTGTVSGEDSVGGLVGYNDAGNVSECLSTGAVSGKRRVGGLVGDNEYGAGVDQCYSTGAVSGNDFVGGLVGSNGFVSVRGGSVTRCYSTGVVRATGGAVGGLVGCNDGDDTVTASFWDIQTSGQTSSDGGTGKTTAEMQTASTFLDAGWDFVDETANGTEDLWWILERKDYPRLWWEAAKK